MKSQGTLEIAQIPDAVLVVSRDGSIVFANRHADRVFGYERGKLVGLTIESLIPERHRERHARLVEGFFAKPLARAMGAERELRALRTDGKEFPVEIAIGPAENGTYTVAVVRDITALVEIRGRLEERASEVRDLDQSFSNTPIGLCYFDKELRYLRVNEWLARLNGLPVKEHLGRKIADVLPDVAAAVESQLRHVLQTGEPIVDGLVEATTPAHPTTSRTYMHNYFPDRSADGAVVGINCVVQDITEAKKELVGALSEIEALRDQLQAENIYFQREIKSNHNFDEIIGNNAAMMATIYRVEQVARTDSTVLLLGETGTGKELLARAIHSRSARKDRPLIKVDCATLPSGLIESELFGHEKGAFTGAHESKTGRFELADNGTIFLDEISELPIDLQSKLLRVLEDGVIQRVGSTDERRVDVRVIAATNRDLPAEMDHGRFRSDLYYRLSVFPIESPPLRERRDDIPLLVAFFVSKYSAKLGKTIDSVAQASMDALVTYDWPGNIRELRNVIERSIILSSSNNLDVTEALGNVPSPAGVRRGALRQDLLAVERSRIVHALGESGWKIKGAGNAAERLGLTPSTLRSKMKKLEIARP